MIAVMATYVGFLRAINLGARRKFPPAAVVAAVTQAGFTDAETYLNTGNVRFSTTLRSRARIEQRLEDAFLADRGFQVPTIVLTSAELSALVEEAAGLGHGGQHYVSLLKSAPTPAAVEALEARSTTEEVARVGERAVHLMLGESYHQARLTNAVVERHLGVATNRNMRVIRTLAQRWGS